MTIGDHTLQVLKETGNPRVMWGDEGLLHMIANAHGWESNGHLTSDRVMSALRSHCRTKGAVLEQKYTRCRGRWVCVFEPRSVK